MIDARNNGLGGKNPTCSVPAMQGWEGLWSTVKRLYLVAIDGYSKRLWPQTAKQDGDRISKRLLCSIWKKRNDRPNVGGVCLY